MTTTRRKISKTIEVSMQKWELGNWPERLGSCLSVNHEVNERGALSITLDFDETLEPTVKKIVKEGIEAFFRGEDGHPNMYLDVVVDEENSAVDVKLTGKDFLDYELLLSRLTLSEILFGYTSSNGLLEDAIDRDDSGTVVPCWIDRLKKVREMLVDQIEQIDEILEETPARRD